MKKQLNILILGVGGNVSQGIITALRHSRYNCNIVGACISSESLGLYFCDKAYISPYANDPSFVDWVSSICIKEAIDMVFTGVEENIMALESHRNVLNSLGIPFVASPIEYLTIGNNKLSTCVWLKENGLNYPDFAMMDNMEEVCRIVQLKGFPLIAKPCIGKGSQGIIIIHNEHDLSNCPKDGYVLQEILGSKDDEYTVGCYINKSQNLEGMIIMHRWLKHGTTFKAQIEQNDIIEQECKRICSKFKAIGPLNIQLRMHHGTPICFELNVRFSGTTPLRANWGFNDVEALLDEYLFNKPVRLNPNKEGLAYRYYNEAYIDLSMVRNLEQLNHVEKVSLYNNFKEYV